MVELVGVNDSREINDGELLIELRDEVVVGAKSKEVANVLLVDEVEEVVEAEVDEDEVVIGDYYYNYSYYYCCYYYCCCCSILVSMLYL